MKKTAVRLIAAGLGMVFSLCLSAESIRLSGYYKNFSIFFSLPEPVAGGGSLGAVTSRFRLRLQVEPAAGWAFNAAYDLSPRIQDPVFFNGGVFFTETVSPGYRVSDFRSRIYPAPEDPVRTFGLFHNLDRLVVMKRFSWADFYIGRQAIAWGTARVINPTDIIAPFSFNELDTEERRGVDAVRLRIPLGMMDELDLGVAAGEDFKPEASAAFLRWKLYILKTDLSLISLAFRRHLLLGFNLARAVGGAGMWMESALVFPYFFEEVPFAEEDHYFRVSTGFDHNLTSRLYGYVEYHFSSAGKGQPGEYGKLFSTSAFRDGSVYLLGRHYISVGATYQITPLLPGSILILFNAGDLSLTLAPQLEYNIAPDIYLSAGCYLGIGPGPESAQDGQPDTLVMNSEFGTYPDLVFTSFRIYF